MKGLIKLKKHAIKYNLVMGIIYLFIILIGFAAVTKLILILLNQPIYHTLIPAILLKIQNLHRASGVGIATIIITFLLFFFKAWLFEEKLVAIDNIVKTWQLRHFMRKKYNSLFNSSLKYTYIAIDDISSDITCMLRIPSSWADAKDFKISLPALFEYITNQNPNYTFSNFERIGNYYKAKGTIIK